MLIPVRSVLSLQCVFNIALLYPNMHGNFVWITIEININLDDISFLIII